MDNKKEFSRVATTVEQRLQTVLGRANGPVDMEARAVEAEARLTVAQSVNLDSETGVQQRMAGQITHDQSDEGENNVKISTQALADFGKLSNLNEFRYIIKGTILPRELDSLAHERADSGLSNYVAHYAGERGVDRITVDGAGQTESIAIDLVSGASKLRVLPNVDVHSIHMRGAKFSKSSFNNVNVQGDVTIGHGANVSNVSFENSKVEGDFSVVGARAENLDLSHLKVGEAFVFAPTAYNDIIQFGDFSFMSAKYIILQDNATQPPHFYHSNFTGMEFDELHAFSSRGAPAEFVTCTFAGNYTLEDLGPNVDIRASFVLLPDVMPASEDDPRSDLEKELNEKGNITRVSDVAQRLVEYRSSGTAPTVGPRALAARELAENLVRDNVPGITLSPEQRELFKGAMKTFDETLPHVKGYMDIDPQNPFEAASRTDPTMSNGQ